MSSCRSPREGEALQSAGGSFRLRLNEPFYVGLGVCAHDNNALEKAVFSNVEIKQRPQPILESTLETVAISSKDRRVVYTKERAFRSAQLVARRKVLFIQPGRAYLQAAGLGRRSRRRSTPDLPPETTTTTASRPTARRS